MRIHKKNGEVRNAFGQLEPEINPDAPPAAPPSDIPSIVERYITVVGKAVAAIDAANTFDNKAINALASLGRSVAMLQAVEESRIGRIGNKSITEMPTNELRKLVAAKNQTEDTEYEELQGK